MLNEKYSVSMIDNTIFSFCKLMGGFVSDDISAPIGILVVINHCLAEIIRFYEILHGKHMGKDVLWYAI